MNHPTHLVLVKRLVLTLAFAVGLSGGIGRAQVHNVVRFLKPGQYSGPKLNAMCFSPDNRTLAVALSDGRLILVDVRRGRKYGEKKWNYFSVLRTRNAMRYSRDGKRLYMIGSSDRKLLDMELGLPIATETKTVPGTLGVRLQLRDGKIIISEALQGGPAARSGEISAGDEVVGFGAGKSEKIRSVVGWKLKRFIESTEGRAGEYARLKMVSPGQLGDRIVTLRRAAFEDDGSVRRFLPFEPRPPQDNVAWCLSDGCHAFYHAHTGEEVSAFWMQRIYNSTGSNAISPDSQRYAWIGRERTSGEFAIEIFDIGSREPTQFFPNISLDSPSTLVPVKAIRGFAFSPDGKLLLLGSYRRVIAMDSQTGKHVKTLEISPSAAVITATPANAISGVPQVNEDGEIDLLSQIQSTPATPNDAQADDGENWAANSTFAVSTQGLLAVGDHDARVRLFDFESGSYLGTLPTGERDEDQIEQILFTSNGNWLAYYNDENLHIVDVSDRERIQYAK